MGWRRRIGGFMIRWPAGMRGKTILIISQVFVPDPASVGQHVADVAYELARRGDRGLGYTSRRGVGESRGFFSARGKVKWGGGGPPPLSVVLEKKNVVEGFGGGGGLGEGG